MDSLERYRGSIIGLAVGDALGTTVEFCEPGTFEPITDIVGGGPFCLKPGQWTDDTSMALCLADSLIDNRGFNAKDQMDRYARWYREGYLSSTGSCFDIGNATCQALQKYITTGNPYSGSEHPSSAGNGSIMRLAPVALFYAKNLRQGIDKCAESSLPTHAALETLDACRYFGALIIGAIQGVDKDKLLSENYEPIAGVWKANPLGPNIAAVAQGSFKKLQPPDIKGSGYVVKSLEAALWAFYRADNFKEGCLMAVNLGDDADTTGAVYGQLAGAYYGISGIPHEWVDKIFMRDKIITMADEIYRIS